MVYFGPYTLNMGCVRYWKFGGFLLLGAFWVLVFQKLIFLFDFVQIVNPVKVMNQMRIVSPVKFVKQLKLVMS